jgi:tetratricopeptide (TPR) repeat protein
MLFREGPLRGTPQARRVLACFVLVCSWPIFAADLPACRKLMIAGKYEECINQCEEAVTEKARDEEWPILHSQALLAVGRYPEAESAVTNALAQPRLRSNIRLHLAGYHVSNANGNPERAQALLEEINSLVGSRAWAYRDPPNLVTLGRAAVLLGADPKVVLEKFYDVAKKADPDLRDAYLASGELALDKHDYALAAKVFAEALKKFPEDADAHCGLARAYEPSERGRMLKSLETALEHNTNHVPSMLVLVDHLVDAEEYEEADKYLARALAVNPWQPESWAYRAVLAHLRNDSDGEDKARGKALQYWKTNPTVDHLIGKKLSQKYRFAEGSGYQRQALVFDSRFLPAKIQLAQDLLRLGEEVEGWALADEVHHRDGYDVTAFNLATLRETMQKFQTLTNEDFVLRMSRREAPVYGDLVLELLKRAKARLSEKYGIVLERPTMIEIFPEQKDFGVRTFGMPHNPGFLGVCFGSVVTANSPASQGGNPSNWEAVLWHEFCHVITLQLTKNKMPRWLSEGISVYEELQANPAWGQRMNPRYREMILGEDLTPVSELSAAFLSPKSELHVQFAYYQSSLVVEFLVGQFGFDKLRLILQDLGKGVDINVAIPKHTAPMEKIETDFATFAKDRARELGPGLDWEKPESMRAASGKTRERVRIEKTPVNPAVEHHETTSAKVGDPNSTNYWVLLQDGRHLIEDKKWSDAKKPLQTLIQLYPSQTGSQSAYALLAAAHRGLNETDQERESLATLASLDGEATDAYVRLMELGETARDWRLVAENANRFLAVNPLLPQPHRYLARASEELGKAPEAIDSYRRLLLLDPPDPADVHFRLARLLRKAGNPEAKRHVLQALEEAPRFRDAHLLLLEIADASKQSTETSNSKEAKP